MLDCGRTAPGNVSAEGGSFTAPESSVPPGLRPAPSTQALRGHNEESQYRSRRLDETAPMAMQAHRQIRTLGCAEMAGCPALRHATEESVAARLPTQRLMRGRVRIAGQDCLARRPPGL